MWCCWEKDERKCIRNFPISPVPWSFTSRATLPPTPKKSPTSEKTQHLQLSDLALELYRSVSLKGKYLLQGKVKIGKNVSVSASLQSNLCSRCLLRFPFEWAELGQRNYGSGPNTGGADCSTKSFTTVSGFHPRVSILGVSIYRHIYWMELLRSHNALRN